MKLDPQSNPLGIIYDETQSEDTHIKLKCCDCDYIECKIAKKYISDNSKEGCVRKVSEENAAKFYHYVKEIMPF